MANFLVREIQKLEGHKARVCILNWKPDPVEGEPALLASCGADNTVRIWEQDPATGSFHCKKVFEDKVFRSCALTPDILVTTSFDATNDTTHWEDFRYDFSLESDFKHEATLEGHTGDVQMVKCNQHSHQKMKNISSSPVVLTNLSSDDCTIKIWEADFDTAPPRWIISGNLPHYHERPVLSIHWSREGIICSGGADGSICFIDGINDSANGPQFKLLHRKKKAHEKGVHSVQWSSKENRVLASASDGGTIKIWELRS